MDQPPYVMDQIRRTAVLEAIQEVCAHRRWNLLAAHVRRNHVHTVVEAEAEPERVMNDFKTYASRRLNLMKLDPPDRKRWTRHGSTRWLWNPENVSAAMQYVVAEQGETMSVLEDLGLK
jgi:REP element-mobilizing transposase RayT